MGFGDGCPPTGSEGRAPIGVWGGEALKSGDKYGCRLFRNTTKNTKHNNTEINTMKTLLKNNFTYDDGGRTPVSPLATPLK